MINPWITNTLLDSCAFDPANREEQQAADELFRLHREKELSLIIAHSTKREIEHPNTPQWVKREASAKLFSMKVQLTPQELTIKNKLHALITGNGKAEKYAADAEHIFEAQKYGSYFVTADVRLLDKANEVRALCGVIVLRPSEFLRLVRQHALGK
jgi:predicted nucleic acid-binding protein